MTAPAVEGPSTIRPALGAAMIIGAASLWGSLGLFGRLAFEHGVSPLQLASVRAALAFVGVLPIALWRPGILRVRRTDLPLLLAYGAVSVGVFYYVYMEAVDRVPLAVAAALLYTAPGWVVGLAWSLGWEPVRLRRLLPLAMVLAGAFLVTGAWRVLAGGRSIGLSGAAFGLASGLAYALYTLLGKRVRARYSVPTTILYAYGIGTLVLAVGAPPWAVFVEHPEATGIILLMGLGPTLMAALLFYAGLRHIDASAASMLATVEPVVAALLGLAWLGEGLSGATIAGTALIIAAAIVLRPKRSPSTPTSQI
ncbi:MAG: EamA family transporter [Longimicrobiales bacterium]|nr:EamA family transporter [Longimicrobiales bacterium]